MASSALGEVLITLGAAQELSERLPPLSPDHESVALVVASMKVLQRQLTGTSGQTTLVINHSRETVAQARDVLAEVERKYGRSSDR
jgi:ABC-type transport system involved in Fe-S cluster assembly fused permease/ATPase subunit